MPQDVFPTAVFAALRQIAGRSRVQAESLGNSDSTSSKRWLRGRSWWLKKRIHDRGGHRLGEFRGYFFSLWQGKSVLNGGPKRRPAFRVGFSSVSSLPPQALPCTVGC